MKNTIKLFGIIALAAVIGFSFAGCDNPSGSNNNSGKTPLTVGSLKITGLSEYDGRFVMAEEETVGLFAAAVDGITGGKVANGSVGLKVWRKKDGKLTSYMGKDTASFTVKIFEAAVFNQDSTTVAQGSINEVVFYTGKGEGEFVLSEE